MPRLVSFRAGICWRDFPLSLGQRGEREREAAEAVKRCYSNQLCCCLWARATKYLPAWKPLASKHFAGAFQQQIWSARQSQRLGPEVKENGAEVSHFLMAFLKLSLFKFLAFEAFTVKLFWAFEVFKLSNFPNFQASNGWEKKWHE